MANIKISDLPPAITPLDAPNTLFEVTVLEAGEEVSRKITLADIASGGGGQVDSVVSGTNITVDATDPVNPIVNLDAAITGVSVNGVTLDATGVATNFLDETGAYSVPAGGGGANVVAGTVDGQVTIWDIGNNQYEPVISSSILINPATPPTSPLGRISGGGSSTTDVRKAFIHVNIGASASTVWSTDDNGGSPSGFYSRSSMTSSPQVHDWGFWNPANQTGLPIFSMTEDLEFIHEQSAFFEERAAGLASVAARGQVWVRDDVPNVLMYTDDAGTDFVLNGAAGGDVFKVGTPVDNQVGVWTGDGTIEGTANFTFDDGAKTFGLGAGSTFFTESSIYFFQDGNLSLDGESTIIPVLSIIQGGINNQAIAIDPTSMVFSHDAGGLVFNVSGNLARWEFDGNVLRVIDGGGTDFVDQDHDGVDYNFAAFQTTDINFTGLTGRIKQDAETLAFLSEITGDVAKVGTPVDNQVGVWTGDGTIEGTTGLTYDGSDLDITGNITLTGNVDGINIAVDVPANTAKVTNATHTGQVTGATALALDVTAITAQPASGAIATGDTIITNDGGVLSEATFTQLLTFFDANLSFLAFSEFQFFADQLENPNNADWTVNALAPASADSNNAGLTVRLFDDTTEEGVGFTIEVPAGATNIVFDFVARAETAPGIANTVGLDIYNRGIPDNAAVQAWSAATQLTDIDIPTNEFFQEDTQTVTLATLGVTAGETTQFELTRVAPTGGTDLTGDWAMLLVKVSFT